MGKRKPEPDDVYLSFHSVKRGEAYYYGALWQLAML